PLAASGRISVNPIRTILVPTDFSAHSAEAFSAGLTLARALGARLVVLHVAQPPVVAEGGQVLTDPRQGEPTDLVARLRQAHPGDGQVPVQHEVIVADRTGAAAVLEMTDKLGCDLIVMGTHGRTGLSHLLFGSVAEEVVRRAK